MMHLLQSSNRVALSFCNRHVNADESTRESADSEVKKDDSHNGPGAQAVDIIPEFAALGFHVRSCCLLEGGARWAPAALVPKYRLRSSAFAGSVVSEQCRMLRELEIQPEQGYQM